MTPSSIVIYGFTGDLVKRKLLPSLYRLQANGRLDDSVQIFGVSRRDIDIKELREELFAFIKDSDGHCKEQELDKLCARISILTADISKPEDYVGLKQQLDDKLGPTCSLKLFYFAVPPSLFEVVIDNMVEHKMHECGGSSASRLMIEKPFGHDLASAQKLIDKIKPHFGEDSIYRVDHYLAKDMVQNILYFRFHNPIVSEIWNGSNIKSIQISALESLDIQGRAAFYEQTGALRDMLQGHLLQLAALATMDEPSSFEPLDILRRKDQILGSIKPMDNIDKDTVRAQYNGYRQETGNSDSNTETFAAVRFEIDRPEWEGVPIVMRAGKAMSDKITELNIVFETEKSHHHQNTLTFRIHPHEGVALKLAAKRPGLDNEPDQITIDHCYSGPDMADAYDRILHDGIIGDQTLFPSDKQILASWEFIQPVLDHWSKDGQSLGFYEKGAANVPESDALVGKKGWVVHDSWVCNTNH